MTMRLVVREGLSGGRTAMRRILVVDDDALIGQAIRAWLGRHGYRVSTAGSGAEGLAFLERSTFDLLVVDVFMSNMRGFESIRLFRERAPKIPLIAGEPQGGDGVERKDWTFA